MALWLASQTFSPLVWWIRLPIAAVALWLASLDSRYIGLTDSAPDCWCGSLACFDRLLAHLFRRFGSRMLMWIFGLFCLTSVHQLARFCSPLLMWFFGWMCLTFSTSACQIRLPITHMVRWLDLLHFQYFSLLDSARDCWSGSLAGFVLFFVHQLVRFRNNSFSYKGSSRLIESTGACGQHCRPLPAAIGGATNIIIAMSVCFLI